MRVFKFCVVRCQNHELGVYMQINIHNKVGARFKLIVHKGDGVAVRETDWFHNTVLDAGLARMSAGTWIDRCCVGAGNSTPSSTQVALDSFIASTVSRFSSSAGVQTTTQPFYRFAKVVWRFGEGVAAGNLSEIGLGWGNENLWNRALIKDIDGNPTTITVLTDEYLDVISEVRDYPALSSSGQFNLLDKTGALISTHTYTARPFISYASAIFSRVYTAGQCRFYGGGKGDNVTQYPPGEFKGYTSSSSPSNPTNTSLRVVYALGLTELNTSHDTFMISDVHGLVGDTSSGGAGYVFEITPPIVKKDTQIMTYTFEISWGRYEPT